MRIAILPAILLVLSCATTPQAPPPAAMHYVTQAECHPDIPLLDSHDARQTAPKLISKVEPLFPEEVRRAREPIDDLVIVDAVVDESGSVTDVCPLKGDPRLMQAVMDAMRQWKFTPGTIDGRPSAFRFNMTSRFRLR
jgi:TonB family protein